MKMNSFNNKCILEFCEVTVPGRYVGAKVSLTKCEALHIDDRGITWKPTTVA
jgi:hypothetical protein